MSTDAPRRQGIGLRTFLNPGSRAAATSLQMNQSLGTSNSMIVPYTRGRSQTGSRNSDSRPNSRSRSDHDGQIEMSSSVDRDNYTLYDREHVTDSRRWTSINIGQGAHCFAGDDNNNVHLHSHMMGQNPQRPKRDQRVWDKLSIGKNSQAYLGDRNYMPTYIINPTSGSLTTMGARAGHNAEPEPARYRTRTSARDHHSKDFDTEG